MRSPDDMKPVLTVNVYHASADGSSAAFGIPGCCGAYHTGVEINGVEYAFAGVTGVYECRPGDYGDIIDRRQYQSSVPYKEVKKAIDDLGRIFIGDSYHVILKNCNNFSDSLVRACTGQGIPAWINRAAWWISWFKCCFGLFGSKNQYVDQRPLLDRNPTPMFPGQGITVGGSTPARQVTMEEQRQIRLRNLGSSQGQ